MLLGSLFFGTRGKNMLLRRRRNAQLLFGRAGLRGNPIEALALLTPARWAYEDIVTRAEFASGDTSLELQTPDEVPVRLRLNTAELNTFAITLFLLCARRIENVFHMIVLDDPLQNMDELTVTTVARGLGRLLRLWQRFEDGESAWV